MSSSLLFSSIPTEDRIKEYISVLSEKYPFVKSEILGRSVIGRPIYAIKFGVGREKILFAGAFHGMEWLTSLVLLNFIDHLATAKLSRGCIADIDVRTTLSTRQLIVVPMVNPDGVEISLLGSESAGGLSGNVERISEGDTLHWQANAHGVDLNHNFNAGWSSLRKLEHELGIDGPAKTQFGGYSPESEIETRIITSLCREKNFRHAYAFHSQGEEIYWSYGDKTPTRSKLMARIMSAASGYKASKPSGLASHGGFKDWFIEELGKPGFTIEIGKGQNPLSIDQLDDIYAKIEEMLMLCVIM